MSESGGVVMVPKIPHRLHTSYGFMWLPTHKSFCETNVDEKINVKQFQNFFQGKKLSVTSGLNITSVAKI